MLVRVIEDVQNNVKEITFKKKIMNVYTQYYAIKEAQKNNPIRPKSKNYNNASGMGWFKGLEKKPCICKGTSLGLMTVNRCTRLCTQATIINY